MKSVNLNLNYNLVHELNNGYQGLKCRQTLKMAHFCNTGTDQFLRDDPDIVKSQKADTGIAVSCQC